MAAVDNPMEVAVVVSVSCPLSFEVYFERSNADQQTKATPVVEVDMAAAVSNNKVVAVAGNKCAGMIFSPSLRSVDRYWTRKVSLGCASER